MPSFNRVTLMGHITRDPQVKQLPSNTQVAEFGIAMNRKYKTAGGEEREEVTFVDCSAFGKVAEIIGQYMTKGKPIFVEGRLKLDTWEDKQGGGKRSKLSVIVENFQFIGGNQGAAGDEGGQARQPNSRRESAGVGSKPGAPWGDEQQFKDDDIPFKWEGRCGQIL